jgi:hypothetical protein
MRKRARGVPPILKRGLIGLGVLVLLALALFGIAWLVNMHDETLSPEAQALLAAPPNPYAPEDNAYFALAGLDAPSRESMVESGVARIAHYDRELDATLADPTPENLDSLKYSDPQRLEFQGEFDFKQPLDSYWDDIPQHRDNVAQILGANLELYQRYLALHGRRGYFETARPSQLAPVFYVPSNLRTLFLGEVVLRLRGSDPQQRQEALADIEADIRLWRTVLTGTGALISKMLAIAYLHWDELVLADMIADPDAPVPLGPADADAIAPIFALDEWDISKAYAAEFRVQAAFLRTSHAQFRAGWLPPGAPRGVHGFLDRLLERTGGHFYKPNATLNLFAAQVQRLTRAAAPAVPEDPATPAAPHLGSLRTVYNPFGKVLAAASEEAYEPYPARAWDGAAFQRLLRLGYEIRRQKIDTAAIPAFLKAHAEWSTHPANGRPFLWDESTGTIRVQTSGPLPAGRVFAVHVWRAPSG